MANPQTRIIKGNLDRLQVSAGTEITYLGPTASGNVGDLVRGFRVNPGSTGDITVKIDRSDALIDFEIFQEDSFGTGSAPSGYYKYSNVAKAGKGKGVVAVTVTDAAKNYVVLLNFDEYSNASYTGSVTVPT
jgi:hypothetical protein